jgi:GNAT superfamily N-acetyltransferase
MLRSLEQAGLVEVGPADGDRRVRTARLTRSGLAERKVLDRRSGSLAGALLDPLSPAQRDRLVAAMADVERLLTAAMVEIAPADPSSPAAQHCLRSYFTELEARFEGGFDPARSSLPDAGVLRPPRGLLLVATLRGEPIGCGAIRFPDDGPPVIKRMWIADAQRGLGLGRRLLAELEAAAAAGGARTVRLETHRALTEAIKLYRTSGYTEVPRFNVELYAHHWFEKRLDA